MIIGILLRRNEEKLCVKKELFDIIIKVGGMPVGIYLENIDNYLNICDGFILPGGSDYENKELEFIKMVHKLNKPLLGICLGMQEIGLLYNGIMDDTNNHLSLDKYVHEIEIDKMSLLYKIFEKDRILVNSRHQNTIKNPDIKVGAKSLDGIIEEIEDDKCKFFMGIQWHPESLINDINSLKLFSYFIGRCKH